MSLAQSETSIRIDGKPYTLRPTLRTGARLERRYGFESLFKTVADGNLGVFADVIFEASTGHDFSREAIQFTLSSPISKLDAIIPSLLSFILSLCGIDASTLYYITVVASRRHLS